MYVIMNHPLKKNLLEVCEELQFMMCPASLHAFNLCVLFIFIVKNYRPVYKVTMLGPQCAADRWRAARNDVRQRVENCAIPRNWAEIEHKARLLLWAMSRAATEDQGHLRQKPDNQAARKSASGVSTTFFFVWSCRCKSLILGSTSPNDLNW